MGVGWNLEHARPGSTYVTVSKPRCGCAGKPSGMMTAENSGRRKSNGLNECRWCTSRTNGSASCALNCIGQTLPPKASSRRSATPRRAPTCDASTSGKPCHAGHTGRRVCRTILLGGRGESATRATATHVNAISRAFCVARETRERGSLPRTSFTQRCAVSYSCYRREVFYGTGSPATVVP